jgi:hypothetical protein
MNWFEAALFIKETSVIVAAFVNSAWRSEKIAGKGLKCKNGDLGATRCFRGSGATGKAQVMNQPCREGLGV